MPIIICAKCGRATNTAVSDHINRKPYDGKADRCFVAHEDGRWVKGCSYDDANEYEKHYADKVLNDE